MSILKFKLRFHAKQSKTVVTNMIACCVFLRSNLCWDTSLLIPKNLNQIGVFSLSFKDKKLEGCFILSSTMRVVGYSTLKTNSKKKNPKEQILLICVLVFWLEVLKTLL
jgi:hypothetical protein